MLSGVAPYHAGVGSLVVEVGALAVAPTGYSAARRAHYLPAGIVEVVKLVATVAGNDVYLLALIKIFGDFSCGVLLGFSLQLRYFIFHKIVGARRRILVVALKSAEQAREDEKRE
jgi:hypothetical protein